MRVLVIGQGGRESAIVRALNFSSSVTEIHVIRGNPGIKKFAICHDVPIEKHDEVLKLVKKIGFDFKSILKGVIERLFLVISLVNGYSNALTFFSALKLATRLKHDDTGAASNKFNDYYLIGNLVSVIVAIGYVYVYQHFDKIALFNQLIN